MKEYLPGYGKKSPRELIDEIFSREVLGGVLVGVAAGKIVEKVLILLFATTQGMLIGWTIAFIIFVLLFVYWDRVETKVKEDYGDD